MVVLTPLQGEVIEEQLEMWKILKLRMTISRLSTA